jgi:3-polyprenyl-4-hydroxybenzoate decarboxylase
MKKAAIYMRVSTAHQEEEQTIGNQKMEIMERVSKDTDVTLITDYEYKDEGWSACLVSSYTKRLFWKSCVSVALSV